MKTLTDCESLTGINSGNLQISNRFDVPSVAYNGIHYFPSDPSELVKRGDEIKATIQVVSFTGGKLRQDTWYIDPVFHLQLQLFLTSKNNY